MKPLKLKIDNHKALDYEQRLLMIKEHIKKLSSTHEKNNKRYLFLLEELERTYNYELIEELNLIVNSVENAMEEIGLLELYLFQTYLQIAN